MRISSKSGYALRALFDLAQHAGNGLVQSEVIARRQGIPVTYLNQLLITLRRGGLVESVRGPQGGHMLARPPAQISLRDVLVALDGPLLSSEQGRDDLIPTAPEDHEVVDALWDDLRGQLDVLLAEITLEELCQRKRQRNGHMMYHI